MASGPPSVRSSVTSTSIRSPGSARITLRALSAGCSGLDTLIFAIRPLRSSSVIVPVTSAPVNEIRSKLLYTSAYIISPIR